MISYDVFTNAFLQKITEYDFIQMDDQDRTDIVDGLLKRSVIQFSRICKYDLSDRDDESRTFNADIPENELDEIVDIVSEGMVVQWLKPYLYRQENLESVLNTRDFTTYSSAELLYRIGAAHKQAQADYTNMIREYSFNTGDITTLHI